MTDIEKTEHGICRWCAKEGVISYTPLQSLDSKMNKFIEETNVIMMNNKLIKIAEGIFACKECVKAYNLTPFQQ